MERFMTYIPTRVLFGAGTLKELHKQKFAGKKALLIISNGKATRANGYLATTESELKKAGIDWVVFDGIEPNPTKGSVEAGAKCARDSKCDFIVALGGGSVMDASKAIATMATNDGDLWDYIGGGTGKGKEIKCDPLPIIAITTTAGTGSEVDQWGVVTNLATKEKIGFGGDDRLFPYLAIVDPELMLSIPPKLTAYQGFDALFHSTETYINKFSNAMSDMVAKTAITHIAKSLPTAVNEGKNLEARANMAFGNTISGYSMVTGGCTSEHSLEHAMSAYHPELAHGAGLIMISKAYYQHFIDNKVCPDRFIEMAKLLGEKNATCPQDFIVALDKFQKACGVDGLKMSEHGITQKEFETLAKNAKSAMGGLFNCDRINLSLDDCVKIYQKSYK